MSGSGREARPDVRDWSGGPPGFPGVVGSGRAALPDVPEWLRCPHRCPGVVGRHFEMFGSGREALTDVWE